MMTIVKMDEVGDVRGLQFSVIGDTKKAVALLRSVVSELIGEEVELKAGTQQLSLFQDERQSYFYFDYRGKRPTAVVVEVA